jgi:GTP-binding protein EngB required for normal cell division
MTAPDSLPEVLRRCHREELLPLAAAVGVNPRNMTRDPLARAIQQALRTAGSHQIANVVFGKGKPPPWHEVVDDLAVRLKLPRSTEPARTERRVLEAWLERGKPRPVPRADIQEVLAANPWGEPETALQPVGRSPVRKQLGGPILSFMARFALPFFAPAFIVGVMLWLGRPRDNILLPAVLEIARLRVRVKYRYVIALVGPPSVGKDAAIKAIFGFDTGNVNPIAGSTKSVAVYEVPGDHGIEVVNTPGVGDVRGDLTDETRGILDQADLFLFMVNAQGGVRQRERDEFAQVKRRRRPVLVVMNKVDTLKEADRPRMLADSAEKLGLPAEDVVGAAFDPLPQLADAPIGVDGVHAWLVKRLEAEGRDATGLQAMLEP